MHRFFTPAQTKRLWLRDGGCTYPGCSMPRRTGPTPITWCTGQTSAPPTWTTPPCSASGTTPSCTTAASPAASSTPPRRTGRVGPHPRLLRRAARPPGRAGASVTPPRTPPHAGGVRGMSGTRIEQTLGDVRGLHRAPRGRPEESALRPPPGIPHCGVVATTVRPAVLAAVRRSWSPEARANSADGAPDAWSAGEGESGGEVNRVEAADSAAERQRTCSSGQRRSRGDEGHLSRSCSALPTAALSGGCPDGRSDAPSTARPGTR